VGRKSVIVLPVSTVPGVDINDDLRRIDSVKVVFPESVANKQITPRRVHGYSPMCAHIAKLRSFEGCA
jgi:hypothetical protein